MSGVFDRLVGLETEYAIRFSSSELQARQIPKFRLFEALVAALQRRVPTVAAKHFKEGVFMANGGAVWFEAERPAAGGGLIEGATPECRGPREVLVYQRAQDRLLAQCAKSANVAGQFRLIKNDRDSRGNVYGAQENYEATLATGFRLLLWRAGLVLLFPLAVLTWVAILFCIVVTLLYFAAAGLAYLPIKLVTGGRRSMAVFLFGHDLVEGCETCIHVPVWLETILQFGTRLLTAPLAAALYLLLWQTAFRHVRRALLPFLVTRPVFAGAGMVDAEGELHLSDKAPGINCTLGFGGVAGDRPVFCMGHFFKTVYAESWFSPREYLELFSRRARLQIGLGDSNMCQTAEYLRVGATLLVLDAIEAGMFREFPRIRRPIRALHEICRDPALTTKIEIRGNDPATAIQLQRFYLEGCREFLQRQEQAPDEAWEVLRLWRQALDGLEEMVAGGSPSPSLIGSIDWVTKKYLLDFAGADATWQQRKKIDIRYHELSPDGYFDMLRAAGASPVIAGEEEIDRATRSAPADSPATTRGHYIREFACGHEPMAVNWRSVVIGRGWGAKSIRLGRYGRRGKDARQPAAHLRLRSAGPAEQGCDDESA